MVVGENATQMIPRLRMMTRLNLSRKQLVKTHSSGWKTEACGAPLEAAPLPLMTQCPRSAAGTFVRCLREKRSVSGSPSARDCGVIRFHGQRVCRRSLGVCKIVSMDSFAAGRQGTGSEVERQTI